MKKCAPLLNEKFSENVPVLKGCGESRHMWWTVQTTAPLVCKLEYLYVLMLWPQAPRNCTYMLDGIRAISARIVEP
jgi:hypothetical protein